MHGTSGLAVCVIETGAALIRCPSVSVRRTVSHYKVPASKSYRLNYEDVLAART